MASGKDPFSILNNDPNRGVWKTPTPKPKINRYKRGVKPVLEGANSSDDDSSDDDMFKETGSKISLDTRKHQLNLGEGLDLRGQVLKKKTKSNKIGKIPKKESGGSVITKKQREEGPKEIKLKTKDAEVVVRNRRKVKNLETLQNNEQEASLINDENAELGRRYRSEAQEKDSNKDEPERKENEEEESSEEYSSEDEGEVMVNKITRPVFVDKRKRRLEVGMVRIKIKLGSN